jgi:hypothetical protein
MYKSIFYLLFISFGIIIFLLWNGKDGFSVGIESCPSITQYTDNILDWSTDQNPYGISMYFKDLEIYPFQGNCGSCSLHALTSCLSCLYTIELYKHIENCTDFQPITISPRSIADIIFKYSIGIDTYNSCENYDYNNINGDCGLTNVIPQNPYYLLDYLYRLKVSQTSITNSECIYAYPLLRNNPMNISTHLVYRNIMRCMEGDIFDDPNSIIENYNYTDHFDTNDLIDFNIHNMSQSIFTSVPKNLDDFTRTIKEKLQDGPLCITISLANIPYDSLGQLNLVDTFTETASSAFPHTLVLIGYNFDNVLLLNSWPVKISPQKGYLDNYIIDYFTFEQLFNNYTFYNQNYINININIGKKNNPRLFIHRSEIPGEILTPTPPSSTNFLANLPRYYGIGMGLGASLIVLGVSTCAAYFKPSNRRGPTEWAPLETDIEDGP